MLKFLPVLPFCLGALVPAAAASEIEDAATELCEKVKACSMAHIAEADLTPEVRQMMEPMLKNMCETMRAGVREVPQGHELYQPSVDCMRSMAGLSCQDFEDEQKLQTPACKNYQRLAEQASAGD
ncbi:hypothetical protein E2F43_12615 [Seongchinamella unica]|uniref:Uncharacterized protein n=1 Tax=Seongchinamella unica TaxID=2547392 RepID=A0A4R5LPG8_9GAMM|nr:hypothetical protein [Seongchinamella unica]TDG12442.1 hypothetical protein E2F43_12615 [Seongchinamella unica]